MCQVCACVVVGSGVRVWGGREGESIRMHEVRAFRCALGQSLVPKSMLSGSAKLNLRPIIGKVLHSARRPAACRTPTVKITQYHQSKSFLSTSLGSLKDCSRISLTLNTFHGSPMPLSAFSSPISFSRSPPSQPTTNRRGCKRQRRAMSSKASLNVGSINSRKLSAKQSGSLSLKSQVDAMIQSIRNDEDVLNFSDARQHALSLYNQYAELGMVTGEDLASVLRFSYDSEECRSVIQMNMVRPDTSTIKPSTEPFRELADRLRIEGDDRAARQVILDEMPSVLGWDSSSDSRRKCLRMVSQAFEKDSTQLARSREILLKAFLGADQPLTWIEAEKRLALDLDPHGHRDAVYQRMQGSQKSSLLAFSAAKQLLKRIAASGEATVRQFNIMMGHLIFSEDMLQLLEIDMIRLAQIAPDDVSVNILANRLILEGQIDRAMDLISCYSKGEMHDFFLQDRGMKASEKKTACAHDQVLLDKQNLLKSVGLTEQILDSEALAIRRLKLLEHFRNQQSIDGSAKLDRFFNILKSNNAIDTCHFNFAILRNERYFSTDIKHCLEIVMPNLGLSPDPTSYLMFVQKLLLEGDRDSAKLEVDKFILSDPAVSSNDREKNDREKAVKRMQKALSLSPKEDHMKRKRYFFNTFLREKSPPDTESAIKCLKIFDGHGVAHPSFLKEIVKKCASSASMLSLMKESCELTLGPYSHEITKVRAWIYQKLIKQLTLEGNYEMAYRICRRDDDSPEYLLSLNEDYEYTKMTPKTLRQISEDMKQLNTDDAKLYLEALSLPKNQKVKIRMMRLNLMLKQSFARGFEFYSCLAKHGVADTPTFWRMVTACEKSEQLDEVLNTTRGFHKGSVSSSQFVEASFRREQPLNRIDERNKQRAYHKMIELLLAEGKYEYARNLVSKDLAIMPALDNIEPLRKSVRLVERCNWIEETIEGQNSRFLGDCGIETEKLGQRRKKKHFESAANTRRKQTFTAELDDRIEEFRALFNSLGSNPKKQTKGKNVFLSPLEAKDKMFSDYYEWKLRIATDSNKGIAPIAAKHAHKLLAYPMRLCTTIGEMRNLIQTELHDEFSLTSNLLSLPKDLMSEQFFNPQVHQFDDGHFSSPGDDVVSLQKTFTSKTITFPVLPGPDPYIALIQRLILRAEYSSAEEIIAEMKEHGIPTQNAEKVLRFRLDPVGLSKLRTSHIKKWCLRGHRDAEESRVYIDNFMSRLVESGEADAYNFTAAMYFCDSSTEIKEIINGPMAQLGVLPNKSTYKRLLRLLLLEGKHDEAKMIVNNDMPNLCKEVDVQAIANWVQSNDKKSSWRMQYSQLNSYIQEGTPEAWHRANNLYEGVVKKFQTSYGVAQNMMLRWCSTSQEMQHWLGSQNVALHLGIAETVVRQMVLEGDVENAMLQMKTFNSEFDDQENRHSSKHKNHLNFWKNMNEIIENDNKLDEARQKYIKKCIAGGTLLDQAKVQAMFQIWRDNGEIFEISEELEKLGKNFDADQQEDA